jgi:hypothetical protein
MKYSGRLKASRITRHAASPERTPPSLVRDSGDFNWKIQRKFGKIPKVECDEISWENNSENFRKFLDA